MTKQHYAVLDGVRGLAAIAIMFRHMGAFGVPVTPQSYLAVDLFFMLSGAVIANAYEAKLNAGMALGDFMSRRIIRLYPMIALGLALSAINLLYGERGDVKSVWMAISLALICLPDTPVFNLGTTDAAGWSLSYELVANAVYAAGLHRWSIRRLATIAGAFGLVLVAAAFYKGHLDTGYTSKSVPFGFGRVGFSFLAGVILFRLHKAGALKIPAVLQGRWGMVVSVALLFGALLTFPPVGLRPVLALASIFLAFPAIVVIGLESNTGPVAQKACKALGAISYPLYLIHYPLIGLVTVQMVRHGQSANLGAAAIAFAPITIALALWLDKHYDEPVRTWITSRLRSRPARSAEAAAA